MGPLKLHVQQDVVVSKHGGAHRTLHGGEVTLWLKL